MGYELNTSFNERKTKIYGAFSFMTGGFLISISSLISPFPGSLLITSISLVGAILKLLSWKYFTRDDEAAELKPEGYLVMVGDIMLLLGITDLVISLSFAILYE